MVHLLDPSVSAEEIVAALSLSPHPENGHYRETWRDAPDPSMPRGAGSAILFLLKSGERSQWHRIDASELWIWQAGAPLSLFIENAKAALLGPDLRAGQSLHGLVPKKRWQSAVSLGAWSLVTCIVAPAFSFDGFELGPRSRQVPVGE